MLPRTLDELVDALFDHGHRVEDIRSAVERRARQAGVPTARDPADAARPLDSLSRYDDLGVLGAGSMGEVRRVRDRRLGRTLALKLLHAPALKYDSIVARFLEEAQATAQLQHPGIIPVHDLGRLPDGRLWFTMKEVSGQTLGEVIAEVHAVSVGRWRTTPSGWSLRRLIDALRQVCEAVGYAHSRGVVHRDLKPDNVMVGAHGEVMVLDWGLAKLLELGEEEPTEEVAPVWTARSRSDAHRTLVGQVAGTPAYMPPEQAHGKVDEIDARSDVYALGALLYKILSGRPPYDGDTAVAVLRLVRAGPPASLVDAMSPLETFNFGLDLSRAPRPASGLPLPQALVRICERAMAREPADRHDSATSLALELQAWLDGVQRAAEARAVVAQAELKRPQAGALRARARRLRDEAKALMEGVEDWHPEAAKLPAWKKEDEAKELEKQAEFADLEEELLLHGSLTHAPGLIEAHAALAVRYRLEHAEAEAADLDTTRAEALFRRHLNALPDDHRDHAEHVAYLQGDGALTLVTDPPGAEVLLYQYVIQNRRLVPRPLRSLGTTPLRAVSLPMGSYLCVIRHPDRAEVRYPVFIGRGEHWHGIPPEGSDPHPVRLPWVGELGPEDCYVPPGWFQSGGPDASQDSLPPGRVWVDGRVFRRYPVTNRQYVAFLNDLMAQGREADALRCVPQYNRPRGEGARRAEPVAAIYGMEGQRFFLQADAEGDIWPPDAPVIHVDWFSAQAYAAWEAHRTQQAWRLPGELAWEKAARGVDGRAYPWGATYDPSWACSRRSHQGSPVLRNVGDFPVDASPYGVRDMAGGIQDWCADVFLQGGQPIVGGRPAVSGAGDRPEDGRRRCRRGGSFFSHARLLLTTSRGEMPALYRGPSLGFRLARTFL